jgi:hypothetical protein
MPLLLSVGGYVGGYVMRIYLFFCSLGNPQISCLFAGPRQEAYPLQK